MNFDFDAWLKRWEDTAITSTAGAGLLALIVWTFKQVVLKLLPDFPAIQAAQQALVHDLAQQVKNQQALLDANDKALQEVTAQLNAQNRVTNNLLIILAKNGIRVDDQGNLTT